jgi:hypothetical protein
VTHRAEAAVLRSGKLRCARRFKSRHDFGEAFDFFFYQLGDAVFCEVNFGQFCADALGNKTGGKFVEDVQGEELVLTRGHPGLDILKRHFEEVALLFSVPGFIQVKIVWGRLLLDGRGIKGLFAWKFLAVARTTA